MYSAILPRRNICPCGWDWHFVRIMFCSTDRLADRRFRCSQWQCRPWAKSFLMSKAVCRKQTDTFELPNKILEKYTRRIHNSASAGCCQQNEQFTLRLWYNVNRSFVFLWQCASHEVRLQFLEVHPPGYYRRVLSIECRGWIRLCRDAYL